MEIELIEWKEENKRELVRVCHHAQRTYLSDALPYPYTEADADWWLAKVAQEEGRKGIFRAIMADGRIVGNISVNRYNDVYRRDAEIGYLLDKDMWGKGVMSEAVRQILALAFETLDILRITANIYEPNIASRKVVEKNGFHLEGIKRNAVTKKDAVYDLCIYGLCKEEAGYESRKRC